MNKRKLVTAVLALEAEDQEDGAEVNITHQGTKRLLTSHQVKPFFSLTT